MKISLIITVLAFAYVHAFAQKSVIDTSVYGKWASVGGIQFSNNGQYLSYEINGQPLKGSTTVVKATTGNWEKEFTNVHHGSFSEDSRQFIYKTGKDSLCLLTLGSGELKYITHIKTWQMAENSPWLHYRLDTPKNQMVTYNTVTGQQRSFDNTINYQFFSAGLAILFRQDKTDQQVTMLWADLSKDETRTIWQGESPGDLVFNIDGTKLIFSSADSSKTKKQLWLYRKGESAAVTLKIDTLDIDHLSNFSFDHTGNKLFFSVTEPATKPNPHPALASVDIYSYKDAKLQSEQLLQNQNHTFTYVYNITTRQMIRLAGPNEEIKSVLDCDWLLVEQNNGGNDEEWNWNKKSLRSIYLVSIIDGSRKLITENIPEPVCESYQLSPSGKYVVYYDLKVKGYLTYNTVTGKVHDITPGEKVNWASDFGEDNALPYRSLAGILGWTPNDQAVLIRSRYDIFRAYPEDKIPPIDLTNGYGLKHHLSFKLYPDISSPSGNMIDPEKRLLMRFTNEDNKSEGFCKISPTQPKDPEFLSVFPGMFWNPVKSRDTAIYALDIRSEQSAPNYYLTSDFKKFIQITDVQPQKSYNWLTAELVRWRTPDGIRTQGILYKPENFDPKKKYPVIFFYYEKITGQLHNFLAPQYADGQRIDIATYVSNGYLVFLPDIHYKMGHPMKSACNTITSAVNYLKRYRWVDTHKMGLMGHSFGGSETNYIITHSHLFAAAISASGVDDWVSAYNSLRLNGTSRQSYYELIQGRIAATIWQRPDLYLENSPIFKSDKVTTPVLIMANKKDDAVPYEQGFEFFTALRRLGKKAWMLQYDNGGHGLENDTDNKDFTLRSRQFFDYYLVGKMPPKWLTEGIPATRKQIDSGYELDTSGERP